MKAKPIRIVITWSCRNQSHRHMTEKTAQKCIDKTTGKKRTTNIWTKELYAKCLAQRKAGAKLKQIAKTFNVSTERIRQVVAKADRMEAEEEFFAANKNATLNEFYLWNSERMRNSRKDRQ